MSDPRAPVDIASFPTEYEAHAFAALLRDAGIQAAVFGRGASLTGLVQDCVDWRLMVPTSDAERARQTILQAREEHDAALVVRVCPACGYSLVGLERAERCPECGLGLSDARERQRTQGMILDAVPTSPSLLPWKVLWASLAVCAGAGVLAIVIQGIRAVVPYPRIFQDWWTPIPLGFVVLTAGVVVIRRRRRNARKGRQVDRVSP